MTISWDAYFLRIACESAARTKCLSRPIGAALVARGKFCIGTGFNGPPVGVRQCNSPSLWYERYKDFQISLPLELATKNSPLLSDCPRRLLGYKSGEGLFMCAAAHAERNAIDIAARMGIATEGCYLFLSCGIPCLECAKTIIQAGITEVVVAKMEVYEKQPITGLQMLREGGVHLRTYNCDVEAILKEKGMPF